MEEKSLFSSTSNFVTKTMKGMNRLSFLAIIFILLFSTLALSSEQDPEMNKGETVRTTIYTIKLTPLNPFLTPLEPFKRMESMKPFTKMSQKGKERRKSQTYFCDNISRSKRNRIWCEINKR